MSTDEPSAGPAPVADAGVKGAQPQPDRPLQKPWTKMKGQDDADAVIAEVRGERGDKWPYRLAKAALLTPPPGIADPASWAMGRDAVLAYLGYE